MTNPILGELSYLSACTESSWGTLPGSPSWVPLPVLTYGVRFNTERRKSAAFVGVLEEKHSQAIWGMPSGQISTPLYGWHPENASMSQMQWLLAFMLGSSGTGLESTTRPPRAFFWAEGPNTSNKIHTGMVCGGFTLSGSAGGAVQLQIDVSGYDEIGMDSAGNEADTAPTIPADRRKLTEVLFEDCALTLGGSATTMKSFSIKGNFNLAIGREDSHRPTFMIGKKSVIDASFTIRKTDDTWDAFNRTTDNEVETTAALVLKGLHRGDGTGGTDWTVATLSFSRLNLQNAPTEGGMDLQYLNLAFSALKPDSSSNSLTYAITEE